MLHTCWHWIMARDSKTIPWLTPMGHPGHLKTLELLQCNYWSPGMHTFVKNFVDGCAACQQAKINRHPTDPPLMPIKGSMTGWPFAQISYNFITDLPVSAGFDSLMVTVDHGLLKGVILCPCHKKSMPQELQNSSFRMFTEDLACRIKAYLTKDPNLHQKSSKKWDAS